MNTAKGVWNTAAVGDGKFSPQRVTSVTADARAKRGAARVTCANVRRRRGSKDANTRARVFAREVCEVHQKVHGNNRVYAGERLCLTAGLFSLPFPVRTCPPAHALVRCASLKVRSGRSVSERGAGGDGRRHAATHGRGMQSGHCAWVPGRWRENVPLQLVDKIARCMLAFMRCPSKCAGQKRAEDASPIPKPS